MKDKFELRILNQSWISGSKILNGGDLCSHGVIFLRIVDTIISDENDGEWGVNETALALLRTIFNKENRNKRDENRIFYHGCSFIMDSCPITIDWKVTKEGDNVILSNFKKIPDTSAKPILYKNLRVNLPSLDYAKQVYNFAKKSSEFFDNSKLTFDNKLEKRDFEKFWKEYNYLFFKLEKSLI